MEEESKVGHILHINNVPSYTCNHVFETPDNEFTYKSIGFINE